MLSATEPRRAAARLSLVRRFGRERQGVAFVEFALLAPLLIALFLGGFELTRYINTARKLTYLANSVAQMLAQNTSGSVDDDDLHFIIDSTVVIYPDVLPNARAKGVLWWQDIKVTMSSVAFTPTVAGCTTGCTYKANTMWTSNAAPRPCAVQLTPVANTAVPAPSTLPTDAFAPGSLIVVDVVYDYRPVVATQIFGTMTVRRSAYLQPRYVPQVKYGGGTGNIGIGCPGY